MDSKEPRGSTFTRSQFLALTWTLFSIAAVFLGARICVRLKLNKQLQLDDGLVIFSMLMFTALSILQTAYVETTFKVQAVRTEHRPKPADFEEASNRFAQYQWAIAYFFFTGIWAVKGSFLAFYEKMTQRLPHFRRAWQVGVVITFLTYVGSLFAYAFLNGLKFKKSLRNKAINYQFAADFTTDVIITAIPLTLALQSSIPTRQKLLLSLIFGPAALPQVQAGFKYGPPSNTARKGSGFSQLASPNDDSAALSSEGQEPGVIELAESNQTARSEQAEQASNRSGDLSQSIHLDRG
ncbi:MAG: hypothetical protein Q9188_002566 [Gyalolechia gomerana]